MIQRLKLTSKRKLRYNASVFMFCLIVSATVWLLTKFSYQYTSLVTFPIIFTEFPEDKIPLTPGDSAINIAISGTGFSLLRINYFTRKRPFSVNLQHYSQQQLDEYAEINVNTMLVAQQLVERFNISGQVEYVMPENLVLRFEDKVTKRLPVLADVSYSLRRQHFAYDTLRIDPEYVELSGPVTLMDKIRYVKTHPLALEDVDANVHEKIGVVLPEPAERFEVNPSDVLITMQVERFTEAEVEVALQTYNAPEGMRIKLFPETVRVVYMVALRDYREIETGMFSCRVNLDGISSFEGRRLNVELYNAPPAARIVRIIPPDVEFLIMK